MRSMVGFVLPVAVQVNNLMTDSIRVGSLLDLSERAAARITRGRGDWLGLTSYDSFIRYLSPAFADAL
jgi:hypothetical protein